MSETNKLRGGALLALALKEKGVEHAFTLAGGFCNPALEGFMECQMPVINCPHEQIAGHLADGHARITRKPTVCLVGPEGFANAVPAMLEAGGERSPVIFITGSSTLKRQGAGGFKEIDDVAIAAPLVKYSVQITDGERISEFVNRAWTAATTGYPGPVHISLPVDIMFSSFEADAGLDERPYNRTARAVPRAWPDPTELQRILSLVRQAKRPVIIGGHGVWWSQSEAKLETAGRSLKIPVFNVPYHSKLLGEESESYMGLADFHQYHPSKPAIHEADLVLMIGGRLDNQMNFGNPPFFPAGQTLVCINGSHEELENNQAADEVLLSDPGAFLDALTNVGRTWDTWFDLQRQRRSDWVDEWYDHIAAESAKPGKMHPLQLSLDVQEHIGDDDWLIFDGGNTHFWSEIAVNMAGWRGQKLGGIMHPGNYSLLGVGVSFGISAKALHPDRNVVVISGDGAFLSGGLSIEAAFQEGLPITIVIDNNGGLDCISQQQERLFSNGKHFATDFRDIPFHTMCEGMGGHGELVETRDQLAPAMQRAMASGKVAIVNVKCRGVISPIVAATSDKRDKASIE
ncbi:MAG: thiamine pyrophosphate-binding protein [Paracoccaceae bacterium]|nr:thiamine pyrophosphate-binding protein [Paracoccaceae bacterium]MDG1738471.1 thiamine pyrophosphate-binding protein [Paracoccaceae bacterium]MDG2259782.1 thiamine pyrophosphate-binding protein [Paracoccaceae bacterium]